MLKAFKSKNMDRKTYSIERDKHIEERVKNLQMENLFSSVDI